MRAIVHNTNYFKAIILKFKIFIFNSDGKIIYNFCTHRGNIALIYTTIIYYLTIANINKNFEIQNDSLKIIRIMYNCTQLCPIALC